MTRHVTPLAMALIALGCDRIEERVLPDTKP